VAECVETAEQAAALVAMGVEFVQGYCFGKPAPDALHDRPRIPPGLNESSRGISSPSRLS
jgi:EAL domain-containing protein (putative c-di-GMP-specific phosphodiesterase class I)